MVNVNFTDNCIHPNIDNTDVYKREVTWTKTRKIGGEMDGRD